MVQINDLDRAGEVGFGKIPDPFGSIADDDLLFSAAPAPVTSFQVDALAKFFGGLDSARVGGGIRIADRIAFFVPAILGKYTSQFDFARVGRLTFRFADATQGFFLHHGHSRS